MDTRIDPCESITAFDPFGTREWPDILEDIPEAVLVLAGATATGEILYVNAHGTRMFGYERGEIVNYSLTTLIAAHDGDHVLADHQVYGQRPDWWRAGGKIAGRGRRRDGTEFPIEVRLDASGRGEGTARIAIVRDLSERQTVERNLIMQRDSAVRASAVKSRFLAAASHDLRQPLQTIWTMQAVLARALANTEHGSHICAIEESVRDMDQMLASLLDINRLEVGAIQPVIGDFPLRAILPRLRTEFACAAARKALTLDIEDTDEFARSDRMLLPVILRNLVGNAIKYTIHGTVRLQVRASGEHLQIDVRDTGIGIAPENLQRLFEDFYQVDYPRRDSREGVGLGLSIVHTLCGLLEHAVTVESRFGEGSIFTVRVPRGVANDAGMAPPEVMPPTPGRSRGSVKVLHIEDDPGVARSMALLLRLEGYEVTSASTRDEAMEHVKVHALRPDLVLSDYRLPMGFRGDAVVAEIAAWLGFKPPTIMLTGDTAKDHVEQVGRIADRILPKPVDVGVLLHEIGTLLER